jgi:uncharacterized protein
LTLVAVRRTQPWEIIMLRTSSYTIYVPLPDAEDGMLLVHGYTGAYDRVSRGVAEYLQSLEAGPPAQPLHGRWESEPALARTAEAAAPSDHTLEALRKRGYMTEMSVPEEEGHFARFTKKRHQRAMENVSYIFMPTYNCNLRCSYCFQDHMRTKPEFAHLLRTIAPDTVNRIFAAMPTIERSHGAEEGEEFTRNIGFFGGEPLLAANRQIIEYIMNRARMLGPAHFWAVSNATELEGYGDLLGPEGIAMIQITLDGPPEEHDRRRIRADGSGTFEQIARNIDLCLEHGARVSVRVNLDPKNIHEMPRLAEEIVARGWNRERRFSVYTARITPGSENTSIQDIFPTTWDLDNAIDELRATHPPMRVIGRPDDGMEDRARRIFDERAHGSTQHRTSFCSAHSGMYIFDAFGDIYACWERTGDTGVRIGRVLNDGEVEMNQGLNRMWRSRTPASNPTCRKCRYALHCGGGCAVLAEGQKGKFFSNYCDGFADRFRHSVARAYIDHVNGVEGVQQSRVCDL